MEERGATGLWAGLWCVLTVQGRGIKAVTQVLHETGIKGVVRRVGTFVFHTSHREVEFVVWECEERM